MNDDLTPAGAAAVRLAASTVQLRKERDHARDVAVALEQQMARLEAVTSDLERRSRICNVGNTTTITERLRAALEVER